MAIFSSPCRKANDAGPPPALTGAESSVARTRTPRQGLPSPAELYRSSVAIRVVLWILLAAAAASAALVYWAVEMQRRSAVEQAKDFSHSVYEMTMAGFTGLLLLGQGDQRGVFLDQVRHTRHVADLRIVRGEATVRQFGTGNITERPADEDERAALRGGTPVFRLLDDDEGGRLKAVIPALASRNHLGKNCLQCHAVGEGEVLGAVTMEISLDRANAAVRRFTMEVIVAAVILTLPTVVAFYFFISRLVAKPLRHVAAGLERIADGQADLAEGVSQPGEDEIGAAARAFNRAMARGQEMLNAQRLAAGVFDSAMEGITITDANGVIQAVNTAFTQVTGYSAREVIGHTPAVLKSGRQDEDFYRALWHALKEEGRWQGEIWNRRKNGEIYPEWLSITSLRNADGRIENYIAVFSDISERKRAEEIITRQAFHDGLTGLPNRNLFNDRLQHELALAKRYPGPGPALMFLDLDGFKAVNDTLGHDAGDELLRQMAVRLTETVRESDTVARLGGDEFTVILPKIGQHEAEVVAAKIVAAASRPFTLAGRTMRVGASVGLALYPQHGADAESLVRGADEAMYAAKQAGKGGWCVPPAAGGARRAG